MKSIAKLFSAFTTLADSITALAGVIDAARDRLQSQLGHEEIPAVIEHQPEKRKGK